MINLAVKDRGTEETIEGLRDVYEGLGYNVLYGDDEMSCYAILNKNDKVLVLNPHITKCDT